MKSLDISEEDEKQIIEISQDPNLFENLAKSIAPGVWGYEEIKKSLILQLFSGVRKVYADGQKKRGDIHILLIGDPGVAKSVTLNFIADISPKGRYVVGKSPRVVQDLQQPWFVTNILRGWSLEAGAMVLANKGIVCIDELEKMDPNDRSAMHEAMEQQTITISKANVQATLRSETSVLAAANPKFGRFDPFQPVAQQIDLPPTLINRFDIIFTLRDIPDKVKDQRIAAHVLYEHNRNEQTEALIPTNILRKYIAYSRQRFKPILNEDAMKEIEKFYVDLRNMPVATESAMRPIPISATQIENIDKNVGSFSKDEIKQCCNTRKHEKRAIDIMKFYLMQVGYDYESKTFDIDRISSKITSSQRNKIFMVRDIITELEGKIGKMIPTEEIEKELEGRVSKDELNDALVQLERESMIFKPKPGFIQKMQNEKIKLGCWKL